MPASLGTGYDKRAFVTAAQDGEIQAVADMPSGVPSVWVRSMLLGLRARIMQAASAKGEGELLSAADLAPFQIDVVLACSCEHDGTRIFNDTDEDRQAVEGMLPEVIDAISMAALAVSGISGDGAGDISENSDAPSAVSATA
ncbi:hypothetical protein LCGC14_0714650 [marine sediment metagenome]|uniref:Uncharacterized protein n=1 Tax=marine sediment metagenome TaxID=412755 RepID=A0A0F9SZP8_9ZZZZ|nr:hypothetical protein [Phycisphaerae bacterium]